MPESGGCQSTWTTRDKVIVVLALLTWLVFALRYYPGEIGRSILQTGVKVFWSSGLSLIFTRILVRLLRWFEKTRPSRPRIVKIFLILAIAFALMLAIEDYRRHYQQGDSKVSYLQIQHSSCRLLTSKCFV